jgi:hypothetical protein
MVYSGTADLTKILQDEAAGKFIKSVQEETGERGGMLVMGKSSSPINILFFLSILLDSLTRCSLRNQSAARSAARSTARYRTRVPR